VVEAGLAKEIPVGPNRYRARFPAEPVGEGPRGRPSDSRVYQNAPMFIGQCQIRVTESNIALRCGSRYPNGAIRLLGVRFSRKTVVRFCMKNQIVPTGA
jgi:hypothetical protein